MPTNRHSRTPVEAAREALVPLLGMMATLALVAAVNTTATAIKTRTMRVPVNLTKIIPLTMTRKVMALMNPTIIRNVATPVNVAVRRVILHPLTRRGYPGSIRAFRLPHRVAVMAVLLRKRVARGQVNACRIGTLRTLHQVVAAAVAVITPSLRMMIRIGDAGEMCELY